MAGHHASVVRLLDVDCDVVRDLHELLLRDVLLKPRDVRTHAVLSFKNVHVRRFLHHRHVHVAVGAIYDARKIHQVANQVVGESERAASKRRKIRAVINPDLARGLQILQPRQKHVQLVRPVKRRRHSKPKPARETIREKVVRRKVHDQLIVVPNKPSQRLDDARGLVFAARDGIAIRARRTFLCFPNGFEHAEFTRGAAVDVSLDVVAAPIRVKVLADRVVARAQVSNAGAVEPKHAAVVAAHKRALIRAVVKRARPQLWQRLRFFCFFCRQRTTAALLEAEVQRAVDELDDEQHARDEHSDKQQPKREEQ
mmetsp:Transcript_1486/g.3116  ORF Transcript_1486/g.3116 Transcript_1486/m.3116 type:complete len:312 (-) Transcript_1486:981-1916(-)